MNLYKFKDIVGNSTTISLIKKSVQNRAFKNFTIFYGDEGCGKSTTAGICGLALTCENLVDGEPCLECPQCKANLKALKLQTHSNNLVVKNLGLLNTKEDLDKIIKEVFVLENPIGNSVYLFEEFHALSEGLQTALLEEIDRLDDNIFIIITTTRFSSILKEIRSRAISFQFKRLRDKEMNLLYNRELHRLSNSYDISKLESPEIANIIKNKSRGIPRDLTNLSEFLVKSSPTMEELNDYLGYINMDDILSVIISMRGDFSTALKEIENLVENFSVTDVFYTIKSALMEVFYFIEGNVPISTDLPLDIISITFTSKKIYKCCNYLDTYRGEITKLDLKFIFFKLYLIINNKTEKDIISNSRMDAMSKNREAKELKKEMEGVQLKQSRKEILERESDLHSYFNK